MTDQNSIAPITRDQRRQELAELTFTPTAMFQPKTGKELMDMANMMAGAAFMVRDIYRENPGACMGLIAVNYHYPIPCLHLDPPHSEVDHPDPQGYLALASFPCA